MNDPVNNPGHYNQNGIEVIDVIETYAKDDFRLANVIKYVCRCEYKGTKQQDLRKARWYLDRVIGELAEAERREAEVFLKLPFEGRVAGQCDTPLYNDYYQYNGDEIITYCFNPACQAPIRNSDLYVQGPNGRDYCCTLCVDLHCPSYPLGVV